MAAEDALTLQQQKDRLSAYLSAESRLLSGGQSVKIEAGGVRREFVAGDLQFIQAEIKRLMSSIERMSRGGGMRVMEVIPR